MRSPDAGAPAYDRALLLLGPKRNEVLDLWEVLRYGTDSYGDAGYVSIYGLPPADWFARGIRLLGRTAVECTRDQLADAIGRDIAAAADTAPSTPGVSVIDPFAGSGNTLYWILRHLPRASGLGFELDDQVFRLTKQNLSLLGVPLEILHVDYVRGLRELDLGPDRLLVAFIAPPWGTALSASEGVDLRRTSPPVGNIIDLLAQLFPNPTLFAIQVFERIVPASLTQITRRFDWWEIRIYGFSAAGQNHGLLLATHGWSPRQTNS